MQEKAENENNRKKINETKTKQTADGKFKYNQSWSLEYSKKIVSVVVKDNWKYTCGYNKGIV